jgi:hypothetical protein
MPRIFRICGHIFAWAVVFASGLEARAGERTRRVAVLPVVSVAVSPEEANLLRDRLTGILKQKFDVELAARTVVDEAVTGLCGDPSTWWECLEKAARLLELGRRLEVDAVVAGRVAAIGPARTIRVSLVDLASGQITVEAIRLPANDNRLFPQGFFQPKPAPVPEIKLEAESTKPEAKDEVASAPSPVLAETQDVEPPEPWYTQWETWTLAGVGVAAVATVLTIVLTTDFGGSSSGDWDHREPLP